MWCKHLVSLRIDYTVRRDEMDLIRHYWDGPISCDNPQYGIWSGPPSGGGAQTARDLANAPRGKVSLSGVVRSPIPSLQLPGVPRPPRPAQKR